jgi:hypothetical protein
LQPRFARLCPAPSRAKTANCSYCLVRLWPCEWTPCLGRHGSRGQGCCLSLRRCFWFLAGSLQAQTRSFWTAQSHFAFSAL